MSNTIEIDLGYSLADAELESYYYERGENTLTVRIKLWNAKKCEFIFSDLITFIDRGGNFIMEFCKNISSSEFFKSAMTKNFEDDSHDTNYQLFQFLEIGREPYLEIICKNFKIKECI